MKKITFLILASFSIIVCSSFKNEKTITSYTKPNRGVNNPLGFSVGVGYLIVGVSWNPLILQSHTMGRFGNITQNVTPGSNSVQFIGAVAQPGATLLVSIDTHDIWFKVPVSGYGPCEIISVD